MTLVNKEIIRRKLVKMSEYLQELARLEDISYSDYISDFKHKRSVERLIQLLVDVAVDINSHVLVDEGFAPPQDAFDSFIKVGQIGVLPYEFAEAIAPATGERNIIVHEYEAIDDALVYDSIKETLKMFNEYRGYYLTFLLKRD
jgi:uncharacterized protein YutE (UPF0331/DUF86 family)